jgi:hypothetical protein
MVTEENERIVAVARLAEKEEGEEPEDDGEGVLEEDLAGEDDE